MSRSSLSYIFMEMRERERYGIRTASQFGILFQENKCGKCNGQSQYGSSWWLVF